MASVSMHRKGSTYWTTPPPSIPVVPFHSGSSLWTTKPGRREIWSYVVYALSTGKAKAVKIFVLETSMENKRRFVGPTFYTAREAKKYFLDNESAWPGDQAQLDLDRVQGEGLLKAWARVWSAQTEQLVKTCAESVEAFVDKFNVVDSVHVRVPRTFTDQLLQQVHQEPESSNPKYGHMGGYFFPDRPSSLVDDEDSSPVSPSPTVSDVPVHRRVYAFASLIVDSGQHRALKFGYIRSRQRDDCYFLAATPDYEDDQLEALKVFFEKDDQAYPDFDFDAKWMLEEFMKTTPILATGAPFPV